jgi:hypothetical protein
VKQRAIDIADAEREIIAQWHRWQATRTVRKPAATDALIFYGRLRGQRPDLLAFKSRGDKWQMVRALLPA